MNFQIRIAELRHKEKMGTKEPDENGNGTCGCQSFPMLMHSFQNEVKRMVQPLLQQVDPPETAKASVGSEW